MSIEDHLLKDENILAECGEKDFKFYTTDKRLLKYKKGGLFSKESLHDISYDEVTSISLEIMRGSKDAVVSGIILFMFGVIGPYYLYFLPREMMMLLAAVGGDFDSCWDTL